MDPKVFGWFDSNSSSPTYDPGIDGGLCIVCAKLLVRPVMTISLMPFEPKGDRSYFFRVHKACWLSASEDEKSHYESSCIDTDVEARKKTKALVWLCDCGATFDPKTDAMWNDSWRNNGRAWEHGHSEPLGYLEAKLVRRPDRGNLKEGTL